jgi:hypothetical protein
MAHLAMASSACLLASAGAQSWWVAVLSPAQPSSCMQTKLYFFVLTLTLCSLPACSLRPYAVRLVGSGCRALHAVAGYVSTLRRRASTRFNIIAIAQWDEVRRPLGLAWEQEDKAVASRPEAETADAQVSWDVVHSL